MKTVKIASLICHLLVAASGLLVLSTSSCVSMQTYRDAQARALRSEYNAANLQIEIDQLREQRDALEAQYNVVDSTNIAAGNRDTDPLLGILEVTEETN